MTDESKLIPNKIHTRGIKWVDVRGKTIQTKSPYNNEEAMEIIKILKSRGLKKQKEVQEVLKIGQAEVSQLVNARYHRFSEARLMAFLNKLDRKVTVQVSCRRKNEPLQEVVMA